jgi:asparagine synthase (glutamine-hydrolysing)
MCGFTLFIGYPNPSYNELLACSERGGDDTNIILKDGMIFVFHRLSINGIDNGSQPMMKHNHILMCNGEIYNHTQLRSQHSLPPSKTGSDCEIILDLYNKYGSMNFINDLDGVFSFVLYDVKSKNVYYARDTYGVRPMYIGKGSQEQIVITSTLKGIPKNFESVRQHVPSMYGVICDGKIQCREKKWIRNNPMKYTPSQVRSTLVNAVRKRMMTERPFGCLLSGGLDSSLITGIVVSEHIKNGGSASDIRTFSIGMRGCPDLVNAKSVAEYLGTNHTQWEYDESVFIKNIPNVIRDIGSYDVTTVRASVGNWLIGRNIRETTDIKVVFNGDGADEVCSGYLYSCLAPNVESLMEDQKRLLSNIHNFDVLRSDRCIACHQLEPRTPFLDREFVNAYSSINAALRAPKCVLGASQEDHPHRGLTKWFLRSLFEGEGIIPESVLWRKKEAFSDGVSTSDKSWHQILKDHYEKSLKSTEEEVYRSLYSETYNNYDCIPYKWMPKWSSTTDPSARTLDCYES